jgi:hypothetical protein
MLSGPCDWPAGPLSGPDGRRMTTPACQRERGRLAEALKALQVGTGLSGARLAEMLGWQQSKPVARGPRLRQVAEPGEARDRGEDAGRSSSVAPDSAADTAWQVACGCAGRRCIAREAAGR